MHYFTQTDDVIKFLEENEDELVFKVRDNYKSHIERRKDIQAGIYLNHYDELLLDEMFYFLIRFLADLYKIDIASAHGLTDNLTIELKLSTITIRSIYE